MRFQLDHDWQGNISAPRAELGNSAKTQLLLVLCAVWILIGLIGHAPWKPLESTSISLIQSIVQDHHFIAPLADGETQIESAPLYYLTAGLSAKFFSSILPIHDGARVFNSVWLTILLLMVGMSGRELWSQGVGRHATFIMIGTVGLMLSAHSLNHEIASFTALATGFYALALLHRRLNRAMLFFGVALAVGFLSDGFVPFIILIASALGLLSFKSWREHNLVRFLLVSILIASPFMASWLVLLHQIYPVIFDAWIKNQSNFFTYSNHFYFLRILIWYAWPALPLAFLGLWRFRSQLLHQTKFQLMLTFFAVTFLTLGFSSQSKDINALPLLLPLVALGAGSVEQLKRDFAAALNWFAVMLFTTLGTLIWLGWIAMHFGFPAKLQERMRFLSGTYSIDFNAIAFALALLMTLTWLTVSLRAKLTKRSTVTNWAIGMTFVWGLLMTLWLPMIDHAKSYSIVFLSVKKSLPKHYLCMKSLNVGKAQSYLFRYYTNISLKPLDRSESLHCDLYLIQDEKGSGRMTPGEEWQIIWQGKRAADRKESFRLFQRASKEI